MQVRALLLLSFARVQMPGPWFSCQHALAYLTLFPTLQRRAQMPSKIVRLAPALLCVTARRPFSVNGNTTQPLTAQHFLQPNMQQCCDCSLDPRARTTNTHACSHTTNHNIHPCSRTPGAKCTPDQHPTHLAETGRVTIRTMLESAGDHCF
jgi:hypothetical protein